MTKEEYLKNPAIENDKELSFEEFMKKILDNHLEIFELKEMNLIVYEHKNEFPVKVAISLVFEKEEKESNDS